MHTSALETENQYSVSIEGRLWIADYGLRICNEEKVKPVRIIAGGEIKRKTASPCVLPNLSETNIIKSLSKILLKFFFFKVILKETSSGKALSYFKECLNTTYHLVYIKKKH